MNNVENIIKEPTRISSHSRTLLDPIGITRNMSYLHSGIFETEKHISDHFGTFVFLKSFNVINAPYKRRVWNYKHANYESLNDSIRNFNWSFLRNDDFNSSVLKFTQTFLDIVKLHIPHKYVTVRPQDRPWYNSEIRKMSRKRDRYKHSATISGKLSDWTRYKQTRNKVNNMKKQAKEIFYNNIEFTLNDASSCNPRQYWKIVKTLIKNNSLTCDFIPPLLNEIDGTYSFTDTEKANNLNTYFSSVSTIDDSQARLPHFNSKTNAHLHNIIITEQDVIDILANLNINKANGPDEISHRMLKETRFSICTPLSIIFNRSMQENIFPELWKESNVMPLFKKGDKNLVSNYRPISLISCVGKEMERVIFKYVYNYLHATNLIYDKQSGFLPGHSTVYQLIDIYNQVCSAFDERKSTCIIFCDISKAFDRVWHSGLLFKLRQYGIDGNILNWITSYLMNRKQKCFVGSSFSDIKQVNAGVPQGPVLGPLFFLIYVNDITESLLSISRLYADDSSLAVSSNNVDYIESTLNHDLNIISEWAHKWLVNFNPSKTEVLFFTVSKNNNARPSLMFNNVQLDFVKTHKHLGVTLSDDGTWHAHISNIVSSASKILGTMKLLKFKLKRATLNQIYLSYLRPIIEYASIIWDNCTLYEKELLEKLQYDAARTVTGLTRSVSIENLIKEIGWVSLSDRRKKQKLILIFKHKNGDLPSYLNEIMPEM